MLVTLIWLLVGLGAIWVLMGIWLVILMVASAIPVRRVQQISNLTHRIAILIPAHNEELLISDVVRAALSLDYPPSNVRVIVIADNCTDDTARIAEAAGAVAWERSNLEEVGKGYALQWATHRLLTESSPCDAVVIMDADSYLDNQFLAAINRRLNAGELAMQAYYTVLNATESWRSKLMTVAFALVHYVRPRGRMRLGLSEGLKGNGMCFHLSVLERFPWPGESVTEDIDYTLHLVRSGVCVTFVPEAVVRAQMPVTGSQAAQQRTRWEGGRYRLLKRAASLFVEGLRIGSIRRMDRAVELLIPPFVELVMIAILGGSAAFAIWSLNPTTASLAAMVLWGVSAGSILLYLVGGLMVARVPFGIAASLLVAPGYMLWKLGLYVMMLMRGGPRTWVRTERRSL